MADVKTPREYRTKGQGVSFPYGMPTKAELKRIEELGELNDLWKKYAGRRSRAGLFRLAARYRRKGMYMTAALIQSEARTL
jgi:hypothetical protein